MADSVFYFNGEGDCAICESCTGYYEEEPDRPHWFCNCPIEEIEIEDVHDACEIELRDFSRTSTYDDVSIEFSYDNRENDNLPVTLQVPDGFHEQNLPGGLADEFVEPPMVDYFHAMLPAYSMGTIEVTLRLTTFEVQAEKWLVCAVEEHVELERLVDLVTGSWTGVTDIVDVVVNREDYGILI